MAPVTLLGARVSAGAVWQGLRAAGVALVATVCLGARILVPVTLWVFGFTQPPFCKGYVPLRLRRWRLGLWGYFSIGYFVGC